MPQSTHNRSAELHNLAEHAHDAAARDKSDHLSPHELTKQAEEHSDKTRKRDKGLDDFDAFRCHRTPMAT